MIISMAAPGVVENPAQVLQQAGPRPEAARTVPRPENLLGRVDRSSSESYLTSVVISQNEKALNPDLPDAYRQKVPLVDKYIGSLGIFMQLKPGDRINPPITVKTKLGAEQGKDRIIQVSEVVTDDQGKVMLKDEKGNTVSQAELVQETAQAIEKEMGKTENAGNEKLKAVAKFMTSKARGEKVDRATLVEAAKAVGLLTVDDIADLAQKQLNLTADEIKYLKGEQVPKTTAADGTETEYRPRDEVLKLKEAVGAEPILQVEQAQKALGVMGIDTTSEGLTNNINQGNVEIEVLKVRLQKASTEDEKINLAKQISEIQTRTAVLEKFNTAITAQLGKDWDILKQYYQRVESGAGEGNVDVLIAGLTGGNVEAVADLLMNDEDKGTDIYKDRRAEVIRRLKQTGVVGGGLIGILALLAVLGLKKQ